jgi:L-alanine-DL-glutamate epimerase-like enolase superfamily enzyme
MTRITALRSRSVAVPLAVVTSLSNRNVQARHYGLVEVDGDDGQTGVGFCYVGSAGGTIFPEIVSTLLAPVVVGRDAHEVEGIWEGMYQEALLQGRAGTVMRAISAIDVALWDRNARAAGLPLYKLLGGCREGRVPAYASGGYFVEGKTPEMLADEAEGFVRQGFKALKIKVGRHEDPGLEEERLAAVRARVGRDVIVMLDANNAWKDVPTALRTLKRLERHEPYFIEEPFGPDDVANHARLARATPIPVVTGEIEAGRWRFKALLDSDAAIILQADACVCGGVSEFRRIAATAASYGVTLAPHWFHDVHAHLVASTPNCRYVEFFPNSDVLNFRELIDHQLEAEAGDLLLPNRPGLGFGFRPDRVERFATSPWR